jgi:hypothetical protein
MVGPVQSHSSAYAAADALPASSLSYDGSISHRAAGPGYGYYGPGYGYYGPGPYAYYGGPYHYRHRYWRHYYW